MSFGEQLICYVRQDRIRRHHISPFLPPIYRNFILLVLLAVGIQLLYYIKCFSSSPITLGVGVGELQKDQILFIRGDVLCEFATLDHYPAEKKHPGISNRETEHDQRLYGTGGKNCPLLSLKKYLSKLNPIVYGYSRGQKYQTTKIMTFGTVIAQREKIT